ncbi:MAG: hypothetical protein D6823_03530 [Chloroflexi bacterium]|nr:MAG: hypothetical protein D6823_03530 [Chloroflexota bacterium]
MRTNSSSFASHILKYCLPLLVHSDSQVQRQVTELLLATIGHEVFTILRRQLAEEQADNITQQALKVLEQHSGLIAEIRAFVGIHFETLGLFRLYVNNHELAPSVWNQINQRSHSSWRKAQSLLGYLFHRGHRGATIDEVVTAVWKGQATSSSVIRTFSVLRNAIKLLGGEHFANKALFSDRQTLYLLPTLCTSDVDLFARSVQVAEQAEARDGTLAAVEHYQHAVDLYRGNYLVTVDIYDEDVDDYRYQLLNTYLYVVERVSEYYYSQQQFVRCIECCLRGLRFQPTEEVLTLRLLECYARQSNHAGIERTYRRYLHALHREPDPDDEVIRWIKDWNPELLM